MTQESHNYGRILGKTTGARTRGRAGMRGLPGRAGEWGVRGLVVLGAAGIAFWLTSPTATPETAPSPPPGLAAKATEPFEVRFPSKSDKAAAQPAPAWLMTAPGSAQQQFAMWTARPTSQPADSRRRPSTVCRHREHWQPLLGRGPPQRQPQADRFQRRPDRQHQEPAQPDKTAAAVLARGRGRTAPPGLEEASRP